MRETRDLIVNVDDLDWSEQERGDAFACRRKKLAAFAGADLGCSLYEVPPGKTAWPRHGHLGNEEGIFIAKGEGTLRLGDESFEVEEGEWITLLPEPGWEHQLLNTSEEPLQYLCASTMSDPDVIYYPDSDKVGVFAGSPPGGTGERTLHGYFPVDAAVSYWKGEVDGAGPTDAHRQKEAFRPEVWPPIVDIEEPREMTTEYGTRFSLRGRRVGAAVGARQLQCSYFEVDGGFRSFPRHAHLGIEEAIWVLEGTGSTQIGDEEHPIRPGDYVVYPKGEEFAHNVEADGGSTLRYLCLSTHELPDIVSYPDSKKVGCAGGESFRLTLDAEATLGYWDREPQE